MIDINYLGYIFASLDRGGERCGWVIQFKFGYGSGPAAHYLNSNIWNGATSCLWFSSKVWAVKC